MPGFELFGDLERKEVNDVLDNGVLMRYGFDGMRKGHWKAKALEKELQNTFKSKYVQLVSSGTAAVTVALGFGWSRGRRRGYYAGIYFCGKF
ncbi:DegT/DnrJ/EryC1/StrS aminotransferase [Jejuia pallidilutea]|uniref:DegT/DnrJ/EryC1/StrS aminotransferase n=1 Tax=Jejuia pallidilutea TaxID=504487 RepID=A0A090W3E0_9FLAO|nr:DegT/DnrJ/EryC1/StrS aminotransferase [Jejuia pallidilutea]